MFHADFTYQNKFKVPKEVSSKAPSLFIQCRPGVPFWSKLIDVVGGSLGKNILTPLINRFPGSTPLALGASFEALKLQYGTLQGYEVVRTPWAIHYRDAIDVMPVYDVEFAFPIDIENPELAVRAIHKVINITKQYAKQGQCTTIY